MLTIRWFRLFALGAWAAPLAAHAQTQGPQPVIKEIATIPGVDVDDVLRMPNGNVLVYAADDSIAAYNLTTKRTTLIARGWGSDLAMSPSGDRIAYWRGSEDDKARFVWAIALNPATGGPVGRPQRVSTDEGDCPSFSRDGRSIAFAMGKPIAAREAHGPNLAVVPVTGGPVRVLARFTRQIGETSWSPDGKWIYVQIGARPDTNRFIDRVPVSGGASVHVLTYSHPLNSWGSINGKIAFFRPDAASDGDGRMAYVTARGTRGEFAVPANAVPGYSFSVGRPLMTKTTTPSLLHVLNISGGTLRTIAIDGIDPRNLSWSNDRSHLALITGERPHLELVVMRSDGTDQHKFPYDGGYGLFMSGMPPSWSPDDGSLLYSAKGGCELRLLNIASGVSRSVASVSAPVHIGGQVAWRSDGKLFVTKSVRSLDGGGATDRKIIEVHLDGTQRTLRDLSSLFPQMRAMLLTSTRKAVVENADSLGRITGFVVVSLDGGADRAIRMPSMQTGTRLDYGTVQSDTIFVSQIVAYPSGRAVAIQVMSTESDSAMVLQLPVSANYWVGGPNFVMADGQHFLKIAGFLPSDDKFTLYSIPFDGTAPMAIGHVPTSMVGTSGWSSGFSAHSEVISFFSNGTPTTHLFSVGLDAFLQPTLKH